MKKIILIIISSVILFSTQAQQVKWSNNSTDVLESGRKEIGLFSPLVFGLKDTMQISIHPVWFFIIPNIELKRYWKNAGFADISTIHSVTYPTLLYKVIARRGTGGILPEPSVIPQMFKINNAIIARRKFNNNINLSLKLGIDMTFAFGSSDFPDIEFPVVYPRTYSFNNFLTPYAGINLTGKIYKSFYYDNNLSLFLLTTHNRGYIIEDEFKIQWNLSDKFAIKAGTIYTYGDFPFGKHSKFLPVFDLMFGF